MVLTTTRKAVTPTVLQLDALECGAASLAIVLAHHGRHVPLEELRIACGVSRDGAKAANLLKAARAYGLDGTGLYAEPEALTRLRPPVILFWGFNHFLVWEGSGRRWGRPVMFLNDPARGRRTVPADEFGRNFTGVALTMTPGPGFRRGGRRPAVLRHLPGRIRGGAGFLAAGLLTSALLVAAGIALPSFTRTFVDSVAHAGQAAVGPAFFGLLAAVAALIGGLTFLQQKLFLRARLASSAVTGPGFVRRLLRLPAGFFTQRSPADLTHRMRANESLTDVLVRDLPPAALNALVVTLYAVLLSTYDLALAAIGVGVALLNVVALRVVSRTRRGAIEKLRIDQAKLVTTSYTGLRQVETLKATGGEDDYFRRWAGRLADVISGQQRVGRYSAWLAVVAPALAGIDSALILLVGGLRAVDGALSIGLLVAFQALLAGFSRPLGQLSAVAGRAQELAADLARLRDVENFPVDPVLELSAVDGQVASARLEFDRVTFGYHPLGEPLLTGLSFSVGPGDCVALVGASGSGKSTVSRLAAGLYLPWQGEIRIGGRPRGELSPTAIAAAVAFVDQDVFLFEGTVRDNITLWDPSIPDTAVLAALRDAVLYDEVMARGGIGALVEEDGRNFSGGQRQRLEIARALARDPRILVLDEATSALDTATERLVDANLRRRGCARVVIAHRLSTIRDSDEILVLEHGRVVERGRHDELLAADGRYAELIRSDG